MYKRGFLAPELLNYIKLQTFNLYILANTQSNFLQHIIHTCMRNEEAPNITYLKPSSPISLFVSLSDLVISVN